MQKCNTLSANPKSVGASVLCIGTNGVRRPFFAASESDNHAGDSGFEQEALKALESFLRPEFITRVDEIVAFRPLSKEDFVKIAGIMLDDLQKAVQQNGRTLTIGEGVVQKLVEDSYSEKYGARNLRRAVEKEVEDALAMLIVESRGKDVEHLTVQLEEGKIVARSLDKKELQA